MSAQSPDLSNKPDTVPGRRDALTASPSQAVPATTSPAGGKLPLSATERTRHRRYRHLGRADRDSLWLWCSRTGATADDVDRCWQAFLRRFDLEHTFRLFKQVLGWTAPKIRSPHAADRWTWLIIAAHTQLRLARDLTADLRRPWERPAPPGRLTPARVRRGFRNLRAKTACPAGAPTPATPAPGARQDQRTAIPHPATTWGRPPDENSPSKPHETQTG